MPEGLSSLDPARRADPREHGRQAARSVRDRPAGRQVRRPPPAAQPVSLAVPIDAETSVTLLTVEEAARRLSLGRTTLYMLLKAGQIGSVRIGCRRRVPVAALAAYTSRLTAEQNT